MPRSVPPSLMAALPELLAPPRPTRHLEVRADVVVRAAVRAALRLASARAGAAVSAEFALDPPLAGPDDPRWYSPAVEAALDGFDLPPDSPPNVPPGGPAVRGAVQRAGMHLGDGPGAADAVGEPALGPPAAAALVPAPPPVAGTPGGLAGGWGSDDLELRVRVALGPAQAAALVAGDVPPGIAVVMAVEPGAVLELRRGGPFPGEPSSARGGWAPALGAGPGQGSPPHRSPAPLAAVAALGDDRRGWEGALGIDAYYDLVAAACARRARRRGDVAVVDETLAAAAGHLVFDVRVELGAVGPTTPLADAARAGWAVVGAVLAPADRLARRVEAAVATARGRLAAGGPRSRARGGAVR